MSKIEFNDFWKYNLAKEGERCAIFIYFLYYM